METLSKKKPAIKRELIVINPPLRGPNVQMYRVYEDPNVIELGEVGQPDGCVLWVYQIKWPKPMGNTTKDIEETVRWAREACELKLEEGFAWSDYSLVHGRNNSFLNLLPNREGGSPIPSLGKCLVCLATNRFQYRHDNWGVIDIKQDKRELEKRYKIATLNKFEGGVIEKAQIPFIGMIQNLALQKGDELSKFFS